MICTCENVNMCYVHTKAEGTVFDLVKFFLFDDYNYIVTQTASFLSFLPLLWDLVFLTPEPKAVFEKPPSNVISF